ncbi:MAG TPA: ATPase domain-containing protein [Pirellulales bacterium]|nr:ATPase domain-containing protein [Pirellulales bacterium]
MSHAADRLSTGIPELDEHLGGGLRPGTLTVLAGATGVGKTQLGLDFLNAGLAQEGRRGVVFDMTSRGDSQNHVSYAAEHHHWQLRPMLAEPPPSLESVWPTSRDLGDYLNLFQHTGQRVTQRDLGFDEWLNWKAELAKQLSTAIYFFYGHFIRGVRRAVVDGMEPVERPSESIQFELFEYIYHQILRKQSDWVARDLLREHYRANEAVVAGHSYDHERIGCLLLYTTRENMLEDLIGRPLDEGDIFSNANTVIYLGRVRDGNRLGRALYIAKHRGSRCSDEIVPYRIDEGGVELGTGG